jgi:hypothetical protein
MDEFTNPKNRAGQQTPSILDRQTSAQAYFDGLPQIATRLNPAVSAGGSGWAQQSNGRRHERVQGNITDVNCFRTVEHRIRRF